MHISITINRAMMERGWMVGHASDWNLDLLDW